MHIPNCKSTISNDKASFWALATSVSLLTFSCNFMELEIFLSTIFCSEIILSILDLTVWISCCSSNIFSVLTDFFLVSSAKYDETRGVIMSHTCEWTKYIFTQACLYKNTKVLKYWSSWRIQGLPASSSSLSSFLATTRDRNSRHQDIHFCSTV